ncbi:hypothetical protein LOC68_14240 [Blastopirellula sp. JC732]|uniref:Dihydrodipicolinate synthase family protein n=1 Tax=Blastopirellula sediminis TaxID=2894196 RepID=A0A9X1SKA6_9BACT|nr:hypothetical protein [Blastopirellula sediminis]MCC9607158.1 hypothetical protein [Blastopirellula sediminis]MCC9629549.1 hypothetical protein [Blastopirellula sediminis]
MTTKFIDSLIANPIGAYPAATVACFDPTRGDLPRRQLDPERLVAYLENLSHAGAGAVLLAASTGQGHLRTVDELAEWFAAAGNAKVGPMVKMALLRPEDGEEANARLLDILVEQEIPVVFIRPGTNLPSGASDHDVVENMAPLLKQAADAGRAIGVYSISDVSGVPLTAAATEQLLYKPGGDRIVAAKVTEADYAASTQQYLDSPQLTRLKIVQGWDPHLAQALQDGPKYDIEGRQRVGVTSGPMSLAVYQYNYLLKAAAAQRWNEVAQSQAAVSTIFAAMQDDPNKFADLQRAKVIMGLGQPLTSEVTDEQINRVFEALESLPRGEDRRRLAWSLDLMEDGPYHERLMALAAAT